MSKILPIWWAWQWRVVMAVVLANIAIGLVLGVVKFFLHISQQNFIIITNLLSIGVSIYASIYFLGFVFEKFHIYVPDATDEYKKAAIK